MISVRILSAISWFTLYLALSACSISGLDLDDGTGTTGGPDTSMCPDYCRGVMDCNAGWGGGMQKYASQNECEFECRRFVEDGGSCGMAAESYFACAASIDECSDYAMEHESMCADLEDSFAGWCL